MRAPTAIGGTVVHSECATDSATAPNQTYLNVVRHADGMYTVESVTAGPNATHPVVRSWFTSERAAVDTARSVASGIRADARWFAR
jgi:hypothetical protein